ncbi:hypothetical protein RHGRI_023850 [Rhododendron griersonianum]|uniref:Helitron helicase-like domain-containing protein n=1 Tax=Rhododendron griersonianum TaxID=479676 RepID=A0AAV6J691_9ERIC|nr:hypothetical protein RHGRI_023850 [Rhododendron griersonianum]
MHKRNRGIYTFQIQGQLYHFINELQSSDNKLSHLQLYFYDTDNEVQNRFKFSQSMSMRTSIVERLIRILQQNPYSSFFRNLSRINELDTHQIIIRPKIKQSERIQYYFGCYDPLHYSLLFPFGEPGWHFGIQRVDKKRGDTTCYRQFVLSPRQMLSMKR